MYIPHDYWMICQRTGMKFRRSEMREEPNKDNINSGRWVNKASYEGVHPQEYVRGVEDDPSVPLSFPDTANAVGQTTLIGNAYQHAVKNFVVSLTIAENDPIGILMDNGTTFWSFADEVVSLPGYPLIDLEGNLIFDVNGYIVTTADPVSAYLVTLGSYIHGDASNGNAVYLPALDNEDWL